MNVRVLIADDEPLALEGLQLALSEIDDVEIVSRCPNGSRAIHDIRTLQPDLAILDIAMPGLSGFDVVSSIDEQMRPAIVFLTAHSDYALRAFGVDASGYLLKPVDEEELRQTIEKVRTQLAMQLAASAQEAAHLPSSGRIVVRSAGRVSFIEPNEIVWLEANGDYVKIHTAQGTHMLRAALRDLTNQLADFGFTRIHRSATVNTNFVRELNATDGGDHIIMLCDDTQLRLSRTYRERFIARMRNV